MNILDTLAGSQSGGAVQQQLGQQFGLSDSQVSSALEALVPALAAGFKRNMTSPQSLDGLVSALGGGQHQRYVDNPGSLGHPDTTDDGNGILGHVFGSKEVSREVASRAAAQSGVGESVLKGMLPVVAAMMMGTMSKRMASPATPAAGQSGGGLMDLLTPMLDSDHDGSIVDDVAGMLGRFAGLKQ